MNPKRNQVFGQYARVYDAFYEGKDYARETQFVMDALARNGATPAALLELGCGTGGHAPFLSAHSTVKRYVGIDLSPEMVELARARCPSLRFETGDMLDLSVGERFDVAVALFHVVCYLSTEADLLKAFESIRASLQPGGFFFFDFWHGPGVVQDPPVTRVREIKEGARTIVRESVPTVDPAQETVDVAFTLRVDTGDGSAPDVFRETHRVRFLFRESVQRLLARAGMEIVEWGAWLTGEPPTEKDWNAYCVARVSR